MSVKRWVVVFSVMMVVLLSVPEAPVYAQNPSDPDTPPAYTLPADSLNAPASTCASSTHSGYTVTLCFTAPSPGSALTGPSTVTITVSVSGNAPGVQRANFYLNGSYLLIDFLSPFSFTLPTTKWQDGAYTLSVTALMRDGYVTANAASINVTFNNGINQPPINHNSFTPTPGTTPPNGSPFVVTAAGDGASGETTNTNVTNEIASINPNLFLYLGDVYYAGSSSEFYNWYGSGSTSYSRFWSITDPTVGNHEYLSTPNADGYFDYWNNVPNYYSFNAGGWHFISLNSNGSKVGGTTKGSPEYNWLNQDLAAHSNLCTIAYYHHPLFNIGPEGPATGMTDIWALMAQNGVAIVLNGHDHDYQRWKPLDGSGKQNANGITEIIAGGGGHGIQSISGSDSRVAFKSDTSPQTFGVAVLYLTANSATFKYINYAGTILDSAVISCNKGGGDTQPPSVPAGLTAVANNATQVTLNWQASTDNVGVTGYTIYRNNTSIATVPGNILSYVDNTVQPNTTYSYKVDAFDAAGNHSAQSAPVSVTTPPPSNDTQPPTVPTGLTASATGPTQVSLNWQASTDNIGVTGYTIYRNSASIATVSGNTLSYLDNTVQPSTTYSYTVDAFDAAGNHSAQSSPVSVTTPAGGGNLTFNVSADTNVNSASPTTNYGKSTTWHVDGSPIVNAYLRFTVSGLNGGVIAHAYLHVYANSSSTSGVNDYAVTDNSWVENTVTYNNAPPIGTLLGASGAFSGGSWITYDVTSYVTAEGTYSFGMKTPGATNVSFAAKESGVNIAYLVVTLR